MTQPTVAEIEQEPLNPRQKVFARELGIAIARGGRDDDLIAAYEAAGYKPDRGNARRLAADPRVKAIADEACAEQLRLAGLHIGYLQAKALELLQASPTAIHRELAKWVRPEIIRRGDDVSVRYIMRDDLTPDELARLDAVTWPLSEFKFDKDGAIAIKLPDKKGIIEMLSKQLGIGRDEAPQAVATATTVVQVITGVPRSPDQAPPQTVDA